MKAKALFIITVIISLILLTSLSSCSSDPVVKTKKMENVYQNVDQAFETKTDSVKYFVAPKDMTLWDVSKKYLGTGLRHMEIANMNYAIFQNPNRFRFTGPNPHWDYGIVKKGEKIYLPKDANGPGVKMTKETYQVFKKGENLKKYFIGDVMVVDPEGDAVATPPATANHTPFWSTGFGRFLTYIYNGMLFLIALGLLLLFLAWLFDQLRNIGNGSNTGGGGTGTGGGDDNEEDPCACDNTTTRMQQVPSILEGMGNAAGEFGHSSFSMRDGDFELKLKTSKSPKQRMKDEDVRKIVNEVLGDYYTDNTIVMILERLPKFETREELVDYLNRKFPIEEDDSAGDGEEPPTTE